MAKKKDPEPDIRVNDLGENILHTEDGLRHRVNHESPAKARILEQHSKHLEHQAALVQAGKDRVEAKRKRLRDNGWPPDKSPV